MAMTEAHRIAEVLSGRSLPSRETYRVPCPAHGGRYDNLAITQEGDRVLFYCHSRGCSYEQIAAAIPSYEWNNGAFIPREFTKDKREPKPLTLRAKSSKYSDLAEQIWASASDQHGVPYHAYVKAKGFTYHYGGRLAEMPRDLYPLKKGDSLLVLKMTDEQDCFTGVQVIAERKDASGWVKRSFGSVGMMPLGLFDLRLGKFLVVEGWATGVAAKQLFPWATPLIAFGSNLDRVAELWQRRFPGAEILVVPDDSDNRDLWDLKNDSRFTAELNRKVRLIEGAFHVQAA